MNNELLEMLRAHIAKRGYATEEDFEGITCVPLCMKNVMLGKETEEDLWKYETLSIDTFLLEYHCHDCFYSNRYYTTQAEYAAAAAFEYTKMKNRNLFPDELMKGGFFTFFYRVMFETTEEDLDDLHKNYDDVGSAESFDVRTFDSMQYLVRYPKSYEEGKKYPVILLLHGAGSRGTDIEALKNNSYFALTEKKEEFPFVTVAPLCHKNSWFDLLDTLKNLVRVLPHFSFCDATRIYAMGASMGGYAVWQLAMSCPDVFAAIVPLCGGGMYWNAERLLSTPVWAFHGEQDEVVLPDETKKMVQNINLFGGRARMTLYSDRAHDIWTRVYDDPEVYKWLLSKKRY